MDRTDDCMNFPGCVLLDPGRGRSMGWRRVEVVEMGEACAEVMPFSSSSMLRDSKPFWTLYAA